MSTIDQLLRDKSVRPTPIRVGILSLLLKTRRAYSPNELERAFDQALDRVSLYRCFLTLIQAGLIHRHIDAKGNCSYFCTPLDTFADATSDDVSDSAGFPHFKCSQCETVIPLPKLPPEYIALVRQYQLDNLRLLAEGTCDDCLHRT